MTKIERLNEMQNQVKELQKNISVMQKEIENEKVVFTFDGFVNRDFAVNCKTENDSNIFLAYLQGKGIKWCDGKYPLLDNKWVNYGDQVCYEYDDCGENRLCYCDTEYYKNKKVIQFSISMLNN